MRVGVVLVGEPVIAPRLPAHGAHGPAHNITTARARAHRSNATISLSIPYPFAVTYTPPTAHSWVGFARKGNQGEAPAAVEAWLSGLGPLDLGAGHGARYEFEQRLVRPQSPVHQSQSS